MLSCNVQYKRIRLKRRQRQRFIVNEPSNQIFYNQTRTQNPNNLLTPFM